MAGQEVVPTVLKMVSAVQEQVSVQKRVPAAQEEILTVLGWVQTAQVEVLMGQR